MYAGKDFTPGTSQTEEDIFGFDFRRRLRPGDTLADATWSIFLETDNGLISVDSLLIGGAAVAGTVTYQKIGPFPEGSYRVQAVINSVMGAGPLTFWNRLPIVPVN